MLALVELRKRYAVGQGSQFCVQSAEKGCEKGHRGKTSDETASVRGDGVDDSSM